MYLKSKISNKTKILIIAIIIIMTGLFYLLTIREGHNWGGDFSAYIHHAKNIAEGSNYKDIGYIYNPFRPAFRHHMKEKGIPEAMKARSTREFSHSEIARKTSKAIIPARNTIGRIGKRGTR